MNALLLRAISYARDYGEFQRARDLLVDFVPRSFRDEQEAAIAAKRIEQIEAARTGAQS